MTIGRKYRIVAFIFIAFVVSGLAYFRDIGNNTETAFVARVIDGDTLVLNDSSRVRLLGINAPEHDMYYFDEAKDALKNLVENKTVRLEKDIDSNDQYGRLLRYIFVDNTFVNLELIKNGYANIFIVKPDVKYQKELVDAENQAKVKQIGLWKLSNYTGCITIPDFHYIEQKNNPNDEYVTFTNTCNYTIDFSKWTVKDEARHVYEFKGILQPSSTITLNSGTGTSNSTYLFWNSKTPIWNNDGDTLYLRDGVGYLVLNYSVGR